MALRLSSPLHAAFLGGALGVLGACPGQARAQAQDAVEAPATVETASAESLAEDARALYEAGRFEQAVSTYLRAWRLEPAAGLLYNVAVIYDRKLDEPELALDFYRRYIKAEDAEPAAVERAMARIRALKAGQRESAPVSTPVVPTVESAPASAQPPRDEGRRTAGWVLMGSGGAALVTGGVLALLASNSHQDFETATTVDEKRSTRETGESYALAADLSFGLAAALVGVGAWLLVGEANGPSVDVTLVPGTHGLTLSAGGAL
jgi:tetratricopeptide (TPR) repeat protein